MSDIIYINEPANQDVWFGKISTILEDSEDSEQNNIGIAIVRLADILRTPDTALPNSETTPSTHPKEHSQAKSRINPSSARNTPTMFKTAVERICHPIPLTWSYEQFFRPLPVDYLTTTQIISLFAHMCAMTVFAFETHKKATPVFNRYGWIFEMTTCHNEDITNPNTWRATGKKPLVILPPNSKVRLRTNSPRGSWSGLVESNTWALLDFTEGNHFLFLPSGDTDISKARFFPDVLIDSIHNYNPKSFEQYLCSILNRDFSLERLGCFITGNYINVPTQFIALAAL